MNVYMYKNRPKCFRDGSIFCKRPMYVPPKWIEVVSAKVSKSLFMMTILKGGVHFIRWPLNKGRPLIGPGATAPNEHFFNSAAF